MRAMHLEDLQARGEITIDHSNIKISHFWDVLNHNWKGSTYGDATRSTVNNNYSHSTRKRVISSESKFDQYAEDVVSYVM